MVSDIRTLAVMCSIRRVQRMRGLFVICFVMLVLTTATFGQSTKKVEETYKLRSITKPFFVRWIKELFGPPMGQIETLKLMKDGTFQYSYRDRYCGFPNRDATGKWRKKESRLILEPEDEGSTPWTNLIIKNSRLYSSVDSLEKKTWALKKKFL